MAKNKITAQFQKAQCISVWDDELSELICVIGNSDNKEEKVDISDKVIDLVQDHFVCEKVKLLENAHIEGFEDSVSFDVETKEDGGQKGIRKINLSMISVY